MIKFTKMAGVALVALAAVGSVSWAATQVAKKAAGKRAGMDVTRMATPGDFNPTMQLEQAQGVQTPSAPVIKTKGALRRAMRTADNSGFMGPAVGFCVMTQASDQFKNEAHAYKVYADDPTYTYYNVSGSASPNASKGGVAVDDYYYADQTYGIPLKDWVQKWNMIGETDDDGFSWSYEGTFCNGQYFMFANDATYDPWTDQIFGIVTHTYSSSTKTFAVLDYDNATREFFGSEMSYSDQPFGLAAAQDCLYTLDKDKNLAKVDKKTGAMTVVGATGINYSTINTPSMTIDPRTGRCFISFQTTANISQFGEIDLATGQFTQWWEDEGGMERRYGLWCAELPTSVSPANVENLVAEFPVSQREGKIKFTAPSLTRGGDAISGNLTYTILANGDVLKTGTVTPGQDIEADVTAPADGIFKFAVKTVDAGGNVSRWERTRAAAGNITPKTPEPVIERYNSGFRVVWPQVTTTPDGIEIAADKITYNVKRYPGGDLVYQELPNVEGENSIVDLPTVTDNLTTWYYTVQAVFDGVAATPWAQTECITTGKVYPPYTERFDDRNNATAYTIIDNDGDGNTWIWDNGTYDVPYLYVRAGSTNASDYVISPAVHLEAGKYYRAVWEMGSRSPEWGTKVYGRAWYGTEPTVEGCATVLQDKTDVTGRNFTEVGGYMRVETEGDYYFALENYTLENTWAYMNGLHISAPVLPAAPGDVTNVVVKANPEHPDEAVIKFNAPAVNAEGNTLSDLTSIEIKMDGQTIATLTDVTPGQACEARYTVPQRGQNYQFSFQATNSAGLGKLWYNTYFIGIYQPAVPTDIYGVEKDGKVTLHWTHPTEDVEGNPLSSDFISYDIRLEFDNYAVRPVAEDYQGTSITFDYELTEEGTPEILYVSMRAKTEGGSSDYVASVPVACGPAYEIPWKESFANGSLNGIYGAIALQGSIQWGLFLDTSFTDITSSDADSGFLGMACQQQGGRGLFAFGKIDLTGSTLPIMSISTYSIQGDTPDMNVVRVWAIDDEGKHLVKTIVNKDHAPYWDQLTFPLTEFAGKTIQLAVEAETQTYVYTLIDNLRIMQQMDYNLSLKNLDAPTIVAAGQEFALCATVENNGSKAAEGFTVNLLRDDEVVDIIEVESLAAGDTAEYTFNHLRTTFDAESAEYRVEIEFEADEDPTDNASATVTIINEIPNLPEPTNLRGTAEGLNVNLEWDEPDLGDGTLLPVTESFEKGEAYNLEGTLGWTFIDKDGGEYGGAQNITMPGCAGVPTSFFVIDTTNPQYNESWAPHTGDKMIISMWAKGCANDDWAISPELNGKAQTISFWARSYDAGYTENFRVYYSEGSLDTNDFKMVKGVPNASEEWTLYSFDLPEGAKYFAIRCISDDKFMLFIDDITYIPAGELTIDGYSVYRNGQGAHEGLHPHSNYADQAPREGKHEYHVTATISGMETRPSAPFQLEVSGLAQNLTEGVSVKAVKNAIVMDGLKGDKLTVADANGRVIYTGTPAGTLTVPAATGVYVVVVKGNTYKLIVK